MMRAFVRGLFGILTLLLIGGGALAAPQVLALVASAEPVPLICRDGTCGAVFSAFCLQEERASPVAGTRYHAAGGEGIRVLASRADGSTARLDPAADLAIVSVRTHTMVRLSIPLEVLRRGGFTEIAVAVGPGVSLIPDAAPGDPAPQTEQDLALATGPLRGLGASIVDGAGDPVAAARLTNRLISTLPARGRVDAPTRDGLWDSVLGKTAGGRDASLARQAFDACRAHTEDGGMTTLRDCLGAAHDRFIGGLNNEYWDATKFGF